MAVAPLRTMLATAREEAVVLSTEIAATARTQIAEGSGNVVGVGGKLPNEMNPISVRHSIEMLAKDGRMYLPYNNIDVELSLRSEANILRNPLTVKPTIPAASPLSNATSTSLTTTTLHESSAFSTSTQTSLQTASSLTTSVASESTLIAQTLNRDLATTFKEVVGNATQTGVEEQLEELAEYAKVLSKHAEA